MRAGECRSSRLEDMTKNFGKKRNNLAGQLVEEDGAIVTKVEHMKKNNSGSIINISSVEGHKPDKGLGIYSVSKAAITMLTKSQAKEWGKYGVRSNAICPGLIKTKLSSALWQNEEMLEVWLGDLPIRRAGEPDEISGIAVYLASNASSYTTGETFNVDGGYMIN